MAAQYVRMYENEGLGIQRPILGKLLGYFTTELGALKSKRDIIRCLKRYIIREVYHLIKGGPTVAQKAS